MTLDIEGLDIVDSHCHPFLPALESPAFDGCWTLSTLPVVTEDVRSTVVFQMMMMRLARFLGLPPEAPWSEVAEERTSRYRADPSGHIGALFGDAGIGTLLIDIGYPSKEDEGFEIKPSDFASMLPRQKVRIIVRIEPVMYELLSQELPFREFVSAFRRELRRQIADHNAVALKSTIAYYTGLDIRPVLDKDAEHAYAAVLKSRGGEDVARESVKLYRDFMLLEAIDVAIADRMPIQIHTGMGNAPGIDLKLADPANLQWLISDSHFAEATVVLVHAGYPYHAGAGFLASTHPNVWIDVSEMVPFVGSGAAARLRELFDMAPLRKVMYGSDGFNIPELFWFAARQFKESLAQVLDGLVAAGHVSPSFAQQSAAGILAENARRLYRL